MDDQHLIFSAKFSRILLCKPVAHIVRFIGTAHHQEQDRLLPGGGQLVPVLAPAFNACGEIALVLDAGNRTLALLDVSDPFDWPFDNAIEDRLPDRVVRDNPGEKRAPCEARCSREIELGGQG